MAIFVAFMAKTHQNLFFWYFKRITRSSIEIEWQVILFDHFTSNNFSSLKMLVIEIIISRVTCRLKLAFPKYQNWPFIVTPQPCIISSPFSKWKLRLSLTLPEIQGIKCLQNSSQNNLRNWRPSVYFQNSNYSKLILRRKKQTLLT